MFFRDPFEAFIIAHTPLRAQEDCEGRPKVVSAAGKIGAPAGDGTSLHIVGQGGFYSHREGLRFWISMGIVNSSKCLRI